MPNEQISNAPVTVDKLAIINRIHGRPFNRREAAQNSTGDMLALTAASKLA